MTTPSDDRPLADPGQRALEFLRMWRTDVAPVHERTERTREFRVQYFQMAMRFLAVAHGGALLAVPALAGLLQIRWSRHLDLLLNAECSFLSGLMCVFLALLLTVITLDTDVIRQKGERANARRRLIHARFADRFGDSLESERVHSEAHQRLYWRLGVGLFWTSVVLLTLSALAFLRGSVLAGRLLAAAAAS